MCLISDLTIMSNFHSREVVGRGSETQLQVDENVSEKKREKVKRLHVHQYN